MSTENGMQSTGNRIGSPKSSSTPSSPPSSGGIELPFQPNEPVGHQSSPHSYRHSRAYRHFKNPPQPHMCIRVTTANGEELFINVLSWTRIVIPQEPSDPIPLYGGMRVPPGSPRSPPLVYAVMANPEVLKDSGRHSKDPEERGAMVELMCDFVEAMNPDIKLTRNAVILKDRDISGELKDVWNAVQAQRDREREEQLTQQQQQHHYHNMQPQQIYLPKAAPQYPQQLLHNQQQQFNSQSHNNNSNLTTIDNKILYTETGETEQQAINSSTIEHVNDSSQGNYDNVLQNKNLKSESAINNTEAINMNGASGKDKSPTSSNNCIKNVDTNAKDVTDSTQLTSSVAGAQSINNITNNQVNSLQQQQLQVSNNLQQLNLGLQQQQQQQQVSPTASVPTVITASNTTAINSTTATTTTKTVTTNNSTIPAATVTPTTTSSTPTTTNTTTTTTKKEKLGGFLPNGCHSIFPRFKNNKHKDKEKDKDKESKSNNHSKEKTLLNSFKKSTTAAANAFNNTKSQQQQQQQQNDDNSKSQYEKNCLNLENEVEKLDLNKIDSPANEVLIKLKVASSGAK